MSPNSAPGRPSGMVLALAALQRQHVLALMKAANAEQASPLRCGRRGRLLFTDVLHDFMGDSFWHHKHTLIEYFCEFGTLSHIHLLLLSVVSIAVICPVQLIFVHISVFLSHFYSAEYCVSDFTFFQSLL